MLENCKNAQERWGGVNEIIDRWLASRQQMLVDFCKLSEDVEKLNNDICGNKLTQLCQTMVDYVSAGHFEIYDQLVKEGQDLNDTEGLKAAGTLFEKVDQTTELILDFNDKYQETDDLDAIENDMSHLGEHLAARFEAEDHMIEVLHYAHQGQIEQNA